MVEFKDLHGIIIDGVRHEVDEFNREQIAKFCDAIDELAKKDDFLYQCTLDAEGDDDEEYLCDLLDNWYKADIVLK